MANIIFTTYQAYPDFSQSDQLVAAALSQQGHTVLPWLGSVIWLFFRPPIWSFCASTGIIIIIQKRLSPGWMG